MDGSRFRYIKPYRRPHPRAHDIDTPRHDARVHTLKRMDVHVRVHVHVRMHSWVRGAGVYLTAD